MLMNMQTKKRLLLALTIIGIALLVLIAKYYSVQQTTRWLDPREQGNIFALRECHIEPLHWGYLTPPLRLQAVHELTDTKDLSLPEGFQVQRYSLNTFYQDMATKELICEGEVLGFPLTPYQGRWAQKNEILTFLQGLAQQQAQAFSFDQSFYQPFNFPRVIASFDAEYGLLMLIDGGDRVNSYYKLAYLLADEDEIVVVTTPLGWEYSLRNLEGTHAFLFEE